MTFKRQWSEIWMKIIPTVFLSKQVDMFCGMNGVGYVIWCLLVYSKRLQNLMGPGGEATCCSITTISPNSILCRSRHIPGHQDNEIVHIQDIAPGKILVYYCKYLSKI